VDNFDLEVTGAFLDIRYSGSLAYSKNVGDVHLVQLNNEPTYTTKIAHALNPTTFNITSALDWLETDLRLARVSGYAIIINMHKWDDWQGDWQQQQRFLDMIEKYEVTAIFAGHYHTQGGGKRWMGKVPMFLSGATSQQTYLTASFSDDRKLLHVNLIENNDWQKPHFVHTVLVKSLWASRP
jgi:cytolysin (calcineurin-like family phosphatase)